MATLNLPDSPMARVWRLIKDHLDADPNLGSDNLEIMLVFVDDDPESIRSIGAFGQPTVRIAPGMANWRQFTEASYSVDLLLSIEVFLPTLDADDYFNVQAVLQCALNGLSNNDFRNALVGVGASIGQPDCRQSLQLKPVPGENTTFIASGQFTVNVEFAMTCCP